MKLQGLLRKTELAYINNQLNYKLYLKKRNKENNEKSKI